MLGRLEPRLAEGGDDRATLAAARRRGAGRRSMPRAPSTLAPNGCWPSAPCRRAASKMRGARSRSPRRGCGRRGPAGAADEVLRTGGGAASGNAFVLRAPIAGRVAEVIAALGASYDEGAPLFRIVRTDESSCRRRCRRPMRRCAGHVRPGARGVRASPIPSSSTPDHVHDAGVIDPSTRALPVQIEVDNPSGQLLIGQTGTAILYTGRRSACRWCRRMRC